MRAVKFLFLLLLIFVSKPLLSDIPSGGYFWKNHVFVIMSSCPPALVYVTDSQGRRTGGDPSQAVDSKGFQGNIETGGLEEIPLSEVEQSNEDAADTVTGWHINLFDAPEQTYTLNAIGISSGIETIIFHGDYSNKQHISSNLNLIVTSHMTKQIRITFNPDAKSFVMQRVVSKTDILIDVQTACQLGQITSPLACRFLTDEAKLIQTALEKNREQEAEDLTWVFLHSLGFSRPLGCKDEDHHSEVKQPALGILQEDAKALLDQLEKNPGHPSR